MMTSSDLLEQLESLAKGKQHAEVVALGGKLLESGPNSQVLRCLIQAELCRGDLESASRHAQELLELEPQAALSQQLAGLVCWTRADLVGAEKHFRQACALQPEEAEHHFHLGWLLQMSGRSYEGGFSLQRAIQLRPDYPEAHLRMAWWFARRHDHGLALKSLESCQNLASGRLLLARCLFQSGRPQEAVERLLAQEDRGAALLEALACCPQAWKDERVHQALRAMQGQGALDMARQQAVLLTMLRPQRGPSIWQDSLFLDVLRGSVICQWDFEEFLRQTRREWLAQLSSGREVPVSLEAMVALAVQCWNNEFIYAVTLEEADQLDKLVDTRPEAMAIRACYGPLSEDWSEPADEQLKPLWLRHRQWPAREQELAAGIATRGMPTEGSVSQKVQRQYQENPYPRYLAPRYLATLRPHEWFLSLFPHATPPPIRSSTFPVLVAGCGTGQHLFSVASRFAGARLLGVDLSLASLAYAARQTEEAGLKEVELLQADLCELADLGRTFPIIECVGVLHHLEQPLKGAKVLCELLEPGGFLKIGLYSRRARREIMAAQQLAQSGGFDATAESIRNFRQFLRTFPADEPARWVDRVSDFYSTSNIRDMLFHVQEHCYEVAELAPMLQELGLEFVGFENLPHETSASYHAMFPDDGDMTNLFYWDKFEEIYPQTFLGLIQFWCRKPGPRSEVDSLA